MRDRIYVQLLIILYEIFPAEKGHSLYLEQ